MTPGDLASVLRDLHHEAAALPDPPALRTRVLAIPLVHPRRSRRWRLPRYTRDATWSTTRLVAAAAIVAVGAGALLFAAGQGPAPGPTLAPAPTLTLAPTSPAPTFASVSPSLIRGLQVLEVEPGVLQLVNDGYRDLTRHPAGIYSPDRDVGGTIVSGLDGSAWVFWPEGFFRVGAPVMHAWGAEPHPYARDDIEIGPNGKIWRVADGDLRSFDGTSWTTERKGVAAIDMWPDGTLWALGKDHVARLDADGWTEFRSNVPFQSVLGFWVSPVINDQVRLNTLPDAQVELLVYSYAECAGCGLDLQFLNGRDTADGLSRAVHADIDGVDMDAHGDFWVHQGLEVPGVGVDAESRPVPYLVHVENGRDATVYSAEAGVPTLKTVSEGFRGFVRAAPDGSVWLSPAGDGIARFDGRSWTRYLSGTSMYAIDIGTDGSVWLQAQGLPGGDRPDDVHTYLIPPQPTH